eukprot:scaffold10609_cov21-Cyclotella_meneghiniana.AAC.1
MVEAAPPKQIAASSYCLNKYLPVADEALVVGGPVLMMLWAVQSPHQVEPLEPAAQARLHVLKSKSVVSTEKSTSSSRANAAAEKATHPK